MKKLFYLCIFIFYYNSTINLFLLTLNKTNIKNKIKLKTESHNCYIGLNKNGAIIKEFKKMIFDINYKHILIPKMGEDELKDISNQDKNSELSNGKLKNDLLKLENNPIKYNYYDLKIYFNIFDKDIFYNNIKNKYFTTKVRALQSNEVLEDKGIIGLSSQSDFWLNLKTLTNKNFFIFQLNKKYLKLYTKFNKSFKNIYFFSFTNYNHEIKYFENIDIKIKMGKIKNKFTASMCINNLKDNIISLNKENIEIISLIKKSICKDISKCNTFDDLKPISDNFKIDFRIKGNNYEGNEGYNNFNFILDELYDIKKNKLIFNIEKNENNNLFKNCDVIIGKKFLNKYNLLINLLFHSEKEFIYKIGFKSNVYEIEKKNSYFIIIIISLNVVLFFILCIIIIYINKKKSKKKSERNILPN